MAKEASPARVLKVYVLNKKVARSLTLADSGVAYARGLGHRRRARKIDPRRLPAILVLLGLAGCSYTWATKWSSPELVAPTGSEKMK